MLRTESDGDLRSLRLRTGLSVRELAAYAGLSAPYLSRVERGERPATPDLIRLYTSLPATVDARYRRSAHPDPPERRETALHARPEAEAGTGTTGTTGSGLGFALFGAEVRRLRDDRGKTLGALGEEVFISRAHLSRIEQGSARASERQAQLLDSMLDAGGTLLALHRAQGPDQRIRPPDTDILADAAPPPRGAGCPGCTHVAGGASASDPLGLAATAAAQLADLRVLSHQAGPYHILRELSDTLVNLHHGAQVVSGTSRRVLQAIAVRYAELLGWTAQELGHDDIALRWTQLAGACGRATQEIDAEGYLLVRQSQWYRRHGDARRAAEYARAAADLPRLSPRIRLFAAQREAQAWALARNDVSFRAALRRCDAVQEEISGDPAGHAPASVPDVLEPLALLIPPERLATLLGALGPRPDPVLDRTRVFEACCLIDLGDMVTAADLFAEDMPRLGTGRTGYARLAVRQAIAHARLGEPVRACDIAAPWLSVIVNQGSASLRGDLRLLSRALSRHRGRPEVQAIMPYLTVLARTTGSVPVSPPAREHPPHHLPEGADLWQI